MIAWKPSLSVGIEEIDVQHRELFRRADRFVESIGKASRQDVGILLSYLRLYVVAHFGAEEAWMREVSYPEYEAHKKEHDGFVKGILRLSDEHEKRGGPGLEPMRVATTLTSWLEAHVSGTDTRFAKFLMAKTA
ncbi:MAG TPA: bacteriohemerythrin [Anaeromyxobacteraceae bacterium]|nr:bacteriohemerythrin [Anaeromyxobacteraceae bacterium]